jgi:hypothetical protein
MLRFLRRKRRADPQWEQEVREGLSFLFEEHDAKIVTNTYLPQHLGIKRIIILVNDLLIKIARDASMPTGFLDAYVAPGHQPTEWQPIIFAVLASGAQHEVRPMPSYESFGTFPGLANLIRANWSGLVEAFSILNYPLTKEKIHRISAGARR